MLHSPITGTSFNRRRGAAGSVARVPRPPFDIIYIIRTLTSTRREGFTRCVDTAGGARRRAAQAQAAGDGRRRLLALTVAARRAQSAQCP